MNKDALLATIIGFGIGLVITGALLLGPTLSASFPAFSLPKINFKSAKKPEDRSAEKIVSPRNKVLNNLKNYATLSQQKIKSLFVLENKNEAWFLSIGTHNIYK